MENENAPTSKMPGHFYNRGKFFNFDFFVRTTGLYMDSDVIVSFELSEISSLRTQY